MTREREAILTSGSAEPTQNLLDALLFEASGMKGSSLVVTHDVSLADAVLASDWASPVKQRRDNKPLKLEDWIERELKYAVPLKTLHEHCSDEGLQRQRITSFYFSKDLLPDIQRIVLHFGGLAEFPPETKPKISRMQMKEENGELSYFIGVKGERRDLIDRPEVPVPIPEDLFRALLPFAEEGRAAKNRFIKMGYVIQENGNLAPVEVHIDLLDSAGAESSSVKRNIAEQEELATVDVELSSRSHVARFRAGHHNFDFLRERYGAIELTSGCEERARKALSTKRVAADGFDEEARLVAAEIRIRALDAYPRQLKFFAPVALVSQYFTATGAQPQKVLTYYFPKDCGPEVNERVQASQEIEHLAHGAALKFSAVQVVREGDEVRNFLVVKLKKRDETWQQEVPIEISAKLFRSLRKLATEGASAARRLKKIGCVIDTEGNAVPTSAHLEVIESAGGSDVEENRRLASKLQYGTIVVRLRSSADIDSLREGNHSFDLLRRGVVELTSGTHEPEVLKAIRDKRLASQGFNRSARDAILELHHQIAR